MSKNAVNEAVESKEEQAGENAMNPVQDAPAAGTGVVPAGKTMLQVLAEEKIKELEALNPGFKLDFLNVFTRLRINTRGQFYYELGGQEFKYPDAITVRLLAGEYMYQLWGDVGTENEGELVCYSKDHITNCNGELCSQCPYGQEKCKLRLALAFNILEEGEDEAEIFNMNVPSTAAFAFADYVKLLKKKLNKGVPQIKTLMYTQEQTSKTDTSKRFNAILFKLAE